MPKLSRMPLTAPNYCVVALVSGIHGVVASEIVFHLFGIEFNLLRDAFFGVTSAATWLLLVRLLSGSSWLRAIAVGALSPLAGCVVGCIWVGSGILWLPWVIRYYYLFAPFGIAHALLLEFLLSRWRLEAPGFPVTTAERDRE